MITVSFERPFRKFLQWFAIGHPQGAQFVPSVRYCVGIILTNFVNIFFWQCKFQVCDQCQSWLLNPLDSKGNCCATLNNMNLVQWPLMDGLLHLVGTARRGLVSVTKCNSPPINGQCTNHCISIWWSVALRFNMAIKGLIEIGVNFWGSFCLLLRRCAVCMDWMCISTFDVHH